MVLYKDILILIVKASHRAIKNPENHRKSSKITQERLKIRLKHLQTSSQTTMTPKKLEAYRDRIKEKLRAAGMPVDEWEADAEQHLIDNPRPRPATRIIPTYSGGVRMVRPGYEEYRPHPRHGAPVPRCLARRSISGGGGQCGNFAVRNQYVCPIHGGKVTQKRRDVARELHDQGKGWGRAERKARSEAHRELRRLSKEQLANGQRVPAIHGPKTKSLEDYARYRAALYRKAAKLRALE